MRRRVIGRGSAAILVVAGAGYALARFLRPDAAFDPASPEGIAQRSISCGDLSLSRAFAVREKRETPHGLLLLFTAKCLSPGGQDDVYGYYMFEDVIVGGRRSGRGGWARAAARPRSPFVDFSIGRSWSDHES